mmetsp:Transcript_18409/g.23322  ORF Transcript_18409/g.23322 Transcript_18409/m.23322 type:complete len:80 (-) Transcript_18409:553-792(-)
MLLFTLKFDDDEMKYSQEDPDVVAMEVETVRNMLCHWFTWLVIRLAFIRYLLFLYHLKTKLDASFLVIGIDCGSTSNLR